MDQLTDVEMGCLEDLALEPDGRVPCVAYHARQTLAMVAMGTRGLVTIVGEEICGGRLRYWTITDAGRHVLGQEQARREVACCG